MIIIPNGKVRSGNFSLNKYMEVQWNFYKYENMYLTESILIKILMQIWYKMRIIE